MRVLIVMLFLTGLLTSCGKLENLKMTDVITPSNKYLSGQLNMTLEDIKNSLQWYQYNCGPSTAPLVFDGNNRQSARMIAYTMGLTQMNPVGIINFEQVENTCTTYESYVYLKVMKELFVDESLKTIKYGAMKQCP